MISLDQVFLLEQKVESAVAKIQQLQAENDALRSKCDELTNALSAKSEQLSSFEADQSQIESGIKKALDRLNSIENSVLKTAESAGGQAAKPVIQPQQTAKPVSQPQPAEVQTSPNFNTMEAAQPVPEENEEPATEEDGQDGLGFDIF